MSIRSEAFVDGHSNPVEVSKAIKGRSGKWGYGFAGGLILTSLALAHPGPATLGAMIFCLTTIDLVVGNSKGNFWNKKSK